MNEVSMEVLSSPLPKVRVHGTYGTYAYHLRHGEVPCEECKAAKRFYEKRRRLWRLGHLSTMSHPSMTAWDAGCRCPECTKFHRSYSRERYHRRKAEADG